MSLDWRCPVSLALCAGAYSVALRCFLSVRRLLGPFTVCASPARTNRRVSVLADRRLLVPITAHVFVMCRQSGRDSPNRQAAVHD